jgi:hypothetical protein
MDVCRYVPAERITVYIHIYVNNTFSVVLRSSYDFHVSIIGDRICKVQDGEVLATRRSSIRRDLLSTVL